MGIPEDEHDFRRKLDELLDDVLGTHTPKMDGTDGQISDEDRDDDEAIDEHIKKGNARGALHIVTDLGASLDERIASGQFHDIGRDFIAGAQLQLDSLRVIATPRVYEALNLHVRGNRLATGTCYGMAARQELPRLHGEATFQWSLPDIADNIIEIADLLTFWVLSGQPDRRVAVAQVHATLCSDGTGAFNPTILLSGNNEPVWWREYGLN